MNNITRSKIDVNDMAVSVIGRYKRHDVIDAVPVFEHTLCVNYLFAC